MLNEDDIKKKLVFLQNKAHITVEDDDKIIIKAPTPYSKYISGFFLEYIYDIKWLELDFPKNVIIELDGWLINLNDSDTKDIDFLKQLKDRYNIINKCYNWIGDKL